MRVCNSSPLIAFEQIGATDVLRKLVRTALIPTAVRREVYGGNDPPDWLHERQLAQPLPPRILAVRLGAGESEAIALALEVGADQILLDDLAARRLATSLGLEVIGTLGLLLQAKDRGLVPAVGPLITDLQAHDFRVAGALVAGILAAAGEADP